MRSEDDLGRERRSARAGGAWYLGLAITGFAGLLLIRPAVYDPDNAATTLENLTTDEGLEAAASKHEPLLHEPSLTA